jgi:hypothetical protein
VIEASKKKLSADYLDTLTSIGNLASTYLNQGQWDTAKKLEVQVIEARKKKLSVDYLYTLTSIANLVLIYSN